MEACKTYFLNPGGIFISSEHYRVQTILGSCISVYLWDEKRKIAAINHFVMSNYQSGVRNCKYGDLSLPYMLCEIEKLGASNLRAYVTGGSHNPSLGDAIAIQNISLADNFMHKNRIPVKIRDVGGLMSRKIVFDTFTGEIDIVKGK